LPISFKNLLEGKSAHAERARWSHSYVRCDKGAPTSEVDRASAADCIVTISKMDGVESSRTIIGVSPRVPDGDYIFDRRGRIVKLSMEKRQGWAGRQRAVRVEPRDHRHQVGGLEID
jgi:hypothetical protein